MDLLLAQERPDIELSFRQDRFRYGTIKAAEDGNIEVLLWWMIYYLPYEKLAFGLMAQAAATHGHLNILLWLEDHSMKVLGQSLTWGYCIASNHANVVR